MAGEDAVGAGRAGDPTLGRQPRGSGTRGRASGRGRGRGRGVQRQHKPNVISGHDLYRMRGETVIRTKADIRREAREKEAERDRKWADQAARKERMKQLEARRIASMPLSELEQEEAEDAERERIRNRFLDQEAMDEVKKMSSLVAYAKTASIRERQLKEKKLRAERELEEETIRDLEVEIARMEQMKLWQERESAQRGVREVAKADIQEQLVAAQEQRRLRGERLKKEAVETVAKIKAMEEEDMARARDQDARKKAFRAEVFRANEASIVAKKEVRAAEAAEERRIEAIQKQMDEEAVLAQIEFEVAREKREQQAFKMRGNVQKFMDRRGEVDELRAQRVFEEEDRDLRIADEENARRRAEASAELKRVRDAQVREKELRTAMMIQADKDEFERNVSARRQWMEEERSSRVQVHDRDREHVLEVREQAEERRAREKAEFLRNQAEGDHILEHRTDHYDRLEQVKARKIRELKAAGVEGKYVVELENFNPRRQDLDDYKLGPPRIKPKPET